MVLTQPNGSDIIITAQPKGGVLKGVVVMRNKYTELKKRREKAGFTQVQVAREAHVTPMSYQRYEYGQRIPDAVTAVLIAKALGTTVEKLWGDK